MIPQFSHKVHYMSMKIRCDVNEMQIAKNYFIHKLFSLPDTFF